MSLKKVKPYPGMVITSDVEFEKGEYDFSGNNGIIVEADNIIIEGNGAHIYNVKENGYYGTGISLHGRHGVNIRNLKVSGFDIGLFAKNGTGHIIEFCDFSDCFTDPAWGWDDHGFHGGILFEYMHKCCIRNCKANNVWDALNMRYSNDNIVYNNDFSHTSDTGLKLWNSCRNQIYDNDFSYGIRIDPGEVHARDSSCVLIESGSNNNIFKRNNMTHGGDGLFIRVLNGWMSTGNYFEENDCSYANNNAIEAWADGNTYVRNKANYSSYGFWLGGSDNTVLRENEIAYNGTVFHNAPEAFGNAGISIVNASGSHVLIEDNYIHDNNGPGIAIRYKKEYPSYHWVIQGNRIENNKSVGKYKGHGIYVKNARWITFGCNKFLGNEGEKIYFDENTSDMIFLSNSINNSSSHENPEVNSQKVKAVFETVPQYIFVNEKITFDVSASKNSNEKLCYRWDLGDGIFKTGEKIEHIYENPGFYRMGLTVDNGVKAALAFKNIYVIPSHRIFGTNDDINMWKVSGNSEYYEISRDITCTISGYGSICIKAGAGSEHELAYPVSERLLLDIENNKVFSVFIKYVTDAEPDWKRNNHKPIITFYDDDNNYVQFIPKFTITEKLDIKNNEEKDNWIFISFDIENPDGFEKKVVGQGLNKGIINRVHFNYGNLNPGISTLWMDAMCFTCKR